MCVGLPLFQVNLGDVVPLSVCKTVSHSVVCCLVKNKTESVVTLSGSGFGDVDVVCVMNTSISSKLGCVLSM